MTHRSTALRRTTRATVAIAVSGSFLFAGTAAANAAGSVDLPSFGSLGAFGSSAPESVETPRLATVDNFRDVAGPGYKTPFGHMRTGVFYRANALTPNDADLATLESLKLTAVYDVRTDEEVAQKADRLPAGADYVRIPILSGDLAAGVDQIRTPDDSRSFMREMNRTFVSDPEARAGFAKLLTDLANTDGRQVFHCTAGKDRTGWASMLLQSLAGVSSDDIMSNYLLTNEYTAASMERTYDGIKAGQGQAKADVYRPLLGVDASYLQAGLDELAAKYGTVENYLRTGLDLSPVTLAKLRIKLFG
ncbi:tyrosine-protein phosphatase [Nocardiaceae bacterium NPDC056970]